jgi:BASS family bile acid:Na+ symporter
MFLLDSLEMALVIVFLAAAMASIGMQVTTADLRAQVARRGLRWRTLLANFVVVPAIGILLARCFVDDPAMARAFVLLACTPGGLSALQFTTKAKGAAAYAGGTACLLSLLAVLVSPLILALTLPVGDSAAGPMAWAWQAMLAFVSMPAVLARAFAFLTVFLVVPLVLGMVVKAKAERAAAVLAKVLGLLSVLVFVTMIMLLMAPRKEAMQQIGGQAVVLLLVLVLLSMLVGWLLGGPETATRQVLASATSMRNVALALAIAATLPDANAVMPALIAFSALMVPPSLLLMVACLIVNRRRARSEGTPAPATSGEAANP